MPPACERSQGEGLVAGAEAEGQSRRHLLVGWLTSGPGAPSHAPIHRIVAQLHSAGAQSGLVRATGVG